MGENYKPPFGVTSAEVVTVRLLPFRHSGMCMRPLQLQPSRERQEASCSTRVVRVVGSRWLLTSPKKKQRRSPKVAVLEILEFWKDESFPFQRAAFFQVSGSKNGLTFPKWEDAFQIFGGCWNTDLGDWMYAMYSAKFGYARLPGPWSVI